jgi:hypothetical protein
MARSEDKAQQIVANLIVERGIEIGLRRLLLDFELVTEFSMFSFEQLVAAEEIDRSMLRARHKPSAGLSDARFGPLLSAATEAHCAALRQCRRLAPCGWVAMSRLLVLQTVDCAVCR